MPTTALENERFEEAIDRFLKAQGHERTTPVTVRHSRQPGTVTFECLTTDGQAAADWELWAVRPGDHGYDTAEPTHGIARHLRIYGEW